MKRLLTLLGAAALAINTSYLPYDTFLSYHYPSGLNVVIRQEQSFSPLEKIALDNLATMGFSTLAINPTFYQHSLTSSFIEPLSESQWHYLDRLVDEAKKRGFSIILKPLLDTKTKESRTLLFPDSLDQWLLDYQRHFIAFASFAEQKKLDGIVVGCELDSLLMGAPAVFETTIQNITQHYSGTLYGASTFCSIEDLRFLKQWDQLPVDVIGVDFYPTIHNDSLASTKYGFYEPLYYLESIARTIKKPFAVLEAGYRSIEGGNKRPFDWKKDGNVDTVLQRQSLHHLYRAAQQLHKKTPHFKGIVLWNTDGKKTFVDDILFPQHAYEKGYDVFSKSARTVIEEYNKQRYFFFLSTPYANQ
ncbi:MAG: hypothetical protein QW594_01885 [Candidatus Woesearchaeota archaeon]